MPDLADTCPRPTIRTRIIDGSHYAEWRDPWTGRLRWVTGLSNLDAEQKAQDRILLEWQRREEDRLTYGGPRPSLDHR